MPSDEIDGNKTQNEILTRRILALEMEIKACHRVNSEYRMQIALLIKMMGHTIEDRNKQLRLRGRNGK